MSGIQANLKIGAVTVGQSPRADIIPELEPLLPGAKILECGALDKLSPQELERLSQQPEGDILATRLRDGSEIIIGKHDILPLVASCIQELNKKNVQAILLRGRPIETGKTTDEAVVARRSCPLP